MNAASWWCPGFGHHERSVKTVTPDSDPGSSLGSSRMNPALAGMTAATLNSDNIPVFDNLLETINM
jgi:hypothetical protein